MTLPRSLPSPQCVLSLAILNILKFDFIYFSICWHQYYTTTTKTISVRNTGNLTYSIDLGRPAFPHCIIVILLVIKMYYHIIHWKISSGVFLEMRRCLKSYWYTELNVYKTYFQAFRNIALCSLSSGTSIPVVKNIDLHRRKPI